MPDANPDANAPATSEPTAPSGSATEGPSPNELEPVIDALRQQNAHLEALIKLQRTHGYRTSVLAVAASVFLGMTLFWGVAQTNWGARHFAMPVKFFVDSDTADGLGLGSSSDSEPDASGPADPSDPYATDGYCEPDTSYVDNDDFDCD
ncbi:MAG: hypothetical protein AAGC46_18505 [Solirubrobacteraceae bacterium]|nr:hypothetical protein [Patulibacter sp.]